MQPESPHTRDGTMMCTGTSTPPSRTISRNCSGGCGSQSVSAQNRGIADMANLVAGDLRALGFKDVALVPTSGHPGVFGFYDAGAPRTLLVYMMYDVQPEETGWKVPAFDGAIVETRARHAS